MPEPHLQILSVPSTVKLQGKLQLHKTFLTPIPSMAGAESIMVQSVALCADGKCSVLGQFEEL